MKNILTLWFILFSSALLSQTNLNISNYPFPDTEPCIAVNPVNSNNILASWMRLTGLSQITIFTAMSNDGGTTWSVPLPMPHLYSSFTEADPSLAFYANGVAYICFIDYAPSKDSGYVMVANSNDGGLTWSLPVKAISGMETTDLPIDRPWIAIDNSSGIYNGRLYITSKSVDIGTLPHHVWMKSSSNGGITWSNLKLIDDSIPTSLITNSMGVPSVDGNGNLFIAYASWDLSLSLYARFICAKSTDGGNSFTGYIIANAAANSAITDSLYQGSYCLSANPAISGNLIFLATDARFGDPDILSINSNDGGITWAPNPVRVNNDAINNGAGQDMCWGSFSPDGTYACAWRDRRNGGTGSSAPFEIFIAASSTGGNTFSGNINVSSSPSPVIAIYKGNDFLGIALDNIFVHTDWCDLRTADEEIFTARDSTSAITSIKTIDDDLQVDIYPNPVKNDITIHLNLPYSQKININLINDSGEIVKEITKNKFRQGNTILKADVSNLSKGIYYLNFEYGNKTIKKFLKAE